MYFYDKNLEKIDFNDIIWDNGQGNFGDTAKNSQIIYFLKQFNISKKICLVNHNQFWADLVNESDVDFLLVNCSDHPYNVPVFNISKNSLIIDSDFNKQNYYPFHLLFSAYLSVNEEVNLHSQRTYYACCVNRSPRISRIYNRVKLDNYNINKFKFIWFRAEHSNGPVPDTDDIINKIGKNNYEKFQNINKLSPPYNPKTEYELCAGINDYTDSYLNLVTESNLDNIGFLTEKIYKPIRAGQLFLVQGPIGTINFLRSIGFDTFDDYFDHSYDKIDNWMQRTDFIHAELQRIFFDIEKIYFETTERRLQNLKILKQFEKFDPWTKFVVDQINS